LLRGLESSGANRCGRGFSARAGTECYLLDYLPDSELIRLCRAGEMTASQDLFAVIQRSQELAKATAGAFDVTVGHYANLRRRAKRKGALPTSEQLTEAELLTGWQQVLLDARTRRITLAKNWDAARPRRHCQGLRRGCCATGAGRREASPAPWSPPVVIWPLVIHRRMRRAGR